MFNKLFEFVPPITLVVILSSVILQVKSSSSGLGPLVSLLFGPIGYFVNELIEAVVHYERFKKVCSSAEAVLGRKEYQRLVLSVVEHEDITTYFIDVSSFFVKGRTLEKRFGSFYFVYLIVVFTVLTSLTNVLLSVALFGVLGNKEYYQTCIVGFSGVNFALKVLTTAYLSETGPRTLRGNGPTNYAVWVELILIHVIASENVSFVNHMAGILVGLSYTMGPLKSMMDFPLSFLNASGRPNVDRRRPPNRGRRVWEYNY